MSIGKAEENNTSKICLYKTNIIILLDSNGKYEYYMTTLIANGEIPKYLNDLKKVKEKSKIVFKDKKQIGLAILLDNINQNIPQNNIEGKNALIIKDELKALFNYFIFNKNLINAIESTKTSNKAIYNNNSKFYLITSKFMDKFRSHYPINELFSFLSNKYQNNIPNNDKLYADLNGNQILTKIEQSLNNKLNVEENIFNIEIKTNKNITYPKNFEIIDINFYNDFIVKKNINHRNKIIETELIVNNGKIILAFNNSLNNGTPNGYETIILIGHLENNNYFDTKFISDIFLYINERKSKEAMMAALKNMNYINALNQEKLRNNVFIHSFDNSFKIENKNINNYPQFEDDKNEDNNINQNQNKDNNCDDNATPNIPTLDLGKNILKLFLFLYIHYEEMNENIKKEIKQNSNEKYFLINGDFLKKYKEYYNYQFIVDKIQKDPNVNRVYSQNKNNIIYCKKNKINYEKNISAIIQEFKDDFLIELGKKRENQVLLISDLQSTKDIKTQFIITESQKKLDYYEGNEIINFECIELFLKIESQQIINLIYKRDIDLLIGEQKIFMNLFDNEIKYYYSDIGHLENNIYITDLIIYYYKLSDFQQYFAQIKSDSFKKYLSPHLKDIQEKNISLIMDNEGKKIGKIRKLKNIPDFNNTTIQSQREFKKNDLNENAKKILKLILYNNQFINRINNSIKEDQIQDI